VFIIAAISLDAMFLAFQIDHPQSRGNAAEIFFTALFMVELGVRLCWSRVRQTCVANVFDATVVLAGVVEWILENSFEHRVPGILMLRLLRLFRLQRFARILNFRLFRDLFLMISGLADGFRTMSWAYILVSVVIFVISCIIRQLLSVVCMGARSQDLKAHCAYDQEYFASVPAGMFTSFRCLFGDCSDKNGTPIILHMVKALGPGIALFYSLALATATFGLFNLITGIFVEQTLGAARIHEDRQRKKLITDRVRVAQTMAELVNTLANEAAIRDGKAITKGVFNVIMVRPEIEELLEELDISVPDARDLFEVFDANCNGVVTVDELVTGLTQLADGENKTHLISALLAIRSSHKTLRWLEISASRNMRMCKEITDKISQIEVLTSHCAISIRKSDLS